MISLQHLRHDALPIGLSLLVLCFWLLAGAPARADDLYGAALNPAIQHSTGDAPVIVCGGQKGSTSVQIRGTDLAAVWHKTYRMLFPASAMAEETREPEARFRNKQPAWSINLNRDKAMLTLETRW